MKKLTSFIVRFILLLATIPLFASHHFPAEELVPLGKEYRWVPPVKYKDFANFIYELQSGELEKKVSDEDIIRINEYLIFLAQAGANKDDDQEELEKDIAELKEINYQIFLASYLNTNNKIYPEALLKYTNQNIIRCGFWKNVKKGFKATVDFVERNAHKIIAAAVAVGCLYNCLESGELPADAITDSVCRSAAILAANKHSYQQEDKSSKPSSHELVNQYAEKYREKEKTLNKTSQYPTGKIPIHEEARILGAAFSHEQVESIKSMIAESDALLEQSGFQKPHSDNVDFPSIHESIDNDFNSHFSPSDQSSPLAIDYSTLSYSQIGELAYNYGAYHQSIDHFTKAIESTPENPFYYNERSLSYLALGNYQDSYKDLKQYQTLAPSLPEVNSSNYLRNSIAFSKGFGRGVCNATVQSGKYLILSNIKPPFWIAGECIYAMGELSILLHNEGFINSLETIAPEAHSLIYKADSLSTEEYCELLGYCVGKCGSDLILTRKIANGSLNKQASKLAKKFGKAKKQSLLHSAAQLDDVNKFTNMMVAVETCNLKGGILKYSQSALKKMAKRGTLNDTYKKHCPHLFFPKEKSLTFFKQAQDKLKPYRNKSLPETQVRKLIHDAGLPTFKRPKGIPKNYKVMISKKGCGIKYVDPKNSETYIRVMPGKPHSEHPWQRRPYIKQQKKGITLSNDGKKVNGDLKAAHIQLEVYNKYTGG